MTVRIEKSSSVWTVIHSRAEARNAMDPESAEALVEAFLEFDRDRQAAVAVLWGEGGSFCSGWDLKYASTLADRAKFDAEIVRGLGFGLGSSPAPRGPLGPTRLELSKPVIAAVEGPAVAGGIGLAASGNINPARTTPSMFEPVHGSAPDIAGQGKADPTAAILSVAMLLSHLGQDKAAYRIEQAVAADLSSRDPSRPGSTDEIGARIASAAAT